jgi:rapamycin-insensitive companion of mTOR
MYLMTEIYVHNSAFDGIVPPHFYGVMARTELGCQVLQQKGHFTEFAQFVKQHGLENEDSDLILKLKSVLWAVVSCFAHFS